MHPRHDLTSPRAAAIVVLPPPDLAMTIRIELFHAPDCPRCDRARALLRELVAALNDDRLEYRERNVVEALDDAVRLGILATPAIVIDGRLSFTGLPARERLEAALQAAVKARN